MLFVMCHFVVSDKNKYDAFGKGLIFCFNLVLEFLIVSKKNLIIQANQE